MCPLNRVEGKMLAPVSSWMEQGPEMIVRLATLPKEVRARNSSRLLNMTPHLARCFLGLQHAWFEF